MNTGRQTWMHFSRACTPWVLVLMWLVSLVPTVSRGMALPGAIPGASQMAGTPRAGWVEICGAGGLRWVQLDPAASAGQAADLDAPAPPLGYFSDLDHCTLCGLALDRCLSASELAWVVPDPSHPVSFLLRRSPPLSWPHARPRATGPPLLF